MKRASAAFLLVLPLLVGCTSRTRVRVDARPQGTSGREIPPTPAIDTTPAPYTTPIPVLSPVPTGGPASEPTPRFLLTPQFASTPGSETTPATGTGFSPRATLTP
jgi:hypothetical protein